MVMVGMCLFRSDNSLWAHDGSQKVNVLTDPPNLMLQLSFQELVMFAEKRGVDLISSFCGFSSRPINSISDYFNAIMDSLMINIKRLVVNVSRPL